jgi:hypothetical protein
MAVGDVHIKPIRLFDACQVESGQGVFPFTEEEKQHLRTCAQCRQVLEVFARQFSKKKSAPQDAERSGLRPQNGELNKRFGVYRSLCCGAEIVIPEGVRFPDCPNHPKLPTQWKSVKDEKIRRVSAIVPPKKDDPAA